MWYKTKLIKKQTNTTSKKRNVKIWEFSSYETTHANDLNEKKESFPVVKLTSFFPAILF